MQRLFLPYNTPVETVELKFMQLHLHPYYAVGEAHAGANLAKEEVDRLINALKNAYQEQPYAYISHRVHDYSVDPTQTMRIISETSVRAAAFVMHENMKLKIFDYEKLFYRIQLAVFDELTEATDWAEKIIVQLREASVES